MKYHLNKGFSLVPKSDNRGHVLLRNLFRNISPELRVQLDAKPPRYFTPLIVERFVSSDYKVTAISPCTGGLDKLNSYFKTHVLDEDSRTIISLGPVDGAVEIMNYRYNNLEIDFHSLYHIAKHVSPPKASQQVLLRDHIRQGRNSNTMQWTAVRYV